MGALAYRLTKYYTFSNGLHILAGNYIFAANTPVLYDPENYPNPEKFDGFRHYHPRHEAGQSHNHSFLSAGMKNLQFGEGRHVWLMLAHILGTMMWLPKAVCHGPQSANITFTKILLPDLNAEIMLRKIRTL